MPFISQEEGVENKAEPRVRGRALTAALSVGGAEAGGGRGEDVQGEGWTVTGDVRIRGLGLRRGKAGPVKSGPLAAGLGGDVA